MAFVLPENPKFQNKSEEKFYKYCKKNLQNNYIVYFNYEVNYREFDFAILIPERGIAIVEVKGWYAKNIIEVKDNNNMVYNTSKGETIIEASPFKQAKEYMYSFINLIENKLNKSYKALPFVCYPEISKESYSDKSLVLFSPENLTFFVEDLEMQNINNKLISAFDQINLPSINNFDDNTVTSVRKLFENNVQKIKSDKPVQTKGDKSKTPSEASCISANKTKAYSKLYVIPDKSSKSEDMYKNIIAEWDKGIKIYVCTDSTEIMNEIKEQLLTHINNLKLKQFLSYKESNENLFMIFNFTIYKFTGQIDKLEFFTITDGLSVDSSHRDDHLEVLEEINRTSSFNLQQYKLEHAEVNQDMCIRAGAGTGKTYSMLTRIAYLLYIHEYSPEEIVNKIILITFTNKAADNMKEKLKKYLQNMFLLTKDYDYYKMIKNINAMNISTIHSLAKKIIEEYSSNLGLGIDFNVTSGSYDRKKEIEKALNKYLQTNNINLNTDINIYHFVNRVESLISKLENKNIDILNDNINFGTNNQNLEIHKLLQEVIINAEKLFREKVHNSNKVHLSNIIILVKQILEKNNEKLKQLDYDYVFIDEFQDTDDNQIDLIKEFQNLLDFNLFIVGDVKQCIYRFRGAELEAFKRLGVNDDEWLHYTLNENYRTDLNLLKQLERSFSAWDKNDKFIFNYGCKEKLSSHINLNASSDRYFNKVNISNPDEFAVKLKETIDYYYNQLEENESIAILTRTNYEVKKIKSLESSLKSFIETDIGGSLYREKPALDLLKLVMALKNPESPEHLYSLFDTGYTKSNLPKNWIIHNKMMGKDLVGLFEDFPPIKGWSKSIRHLKDYPVLKILRDLVTKNKPYNNTPGYSEKKYKRYYKRNLDAIFEELVNNKNIEYLTLNNIEKSLKLKVYSEFDKEKRETRDLISDQEKNIYCMTVHKAKGLEFNTVILPFTNKSVYSYSQGNNVNMITTKKEETYTLGYSINLAGQYSSKIYINNDIYEKEKKDEKYYNISEEVRILYVAVTRAIKNLSYFKYLDNNQTRLTWQYLIEGGD